MEKVYLSTANDTSKERMHVKYRGKGGSSVAKVVWAGSGATSYGVLQNIVHGSETGTGVANQAPLGLFLQHSTSMLTPVHTLVIIHTAQRLYQLPFTLLGLLLGIHFGRSVDASGAVIPE